MPNSAAEPSPVECLLRALLACLTPFYLTAAGGDPAAASATVIELIESYGAATPAQIDILGRMLAFAAAAMDNLRLSMREGLSDRKILQYRAGAVALGRSAEQCRKALDTMRISQQQQPRAVEAAPAAAAITRPQPTAASRAMPRARPDHVSTLDSDPAFATDIGTMQRNALAMLADLRARAESVLTEPPGTPGPLNGAQRPQPIRCGSAATM